MAFEKPPILTGDNRRDITNLRDYLFRVAGSLDPVAGSNTTSLQVVRQNGKTITKQAAAAKTDIEAVIANAKELRSLILKTAKDVDKEEIARITADGNVETTVKSYVDGKVEVYNELYVARSEYGTFTESIGRRIEDGARGVVETYNYDSKIQSVQDGVSLLQNYYEDITGEIQRGIVWDPDIQDWVLGIAISQRMRFTGEVEVADDGFTYYYLDSGQTFGLYTSTGWQFWIDGVKVGWFNSMDGMLHVRNVFVEERFIVGGQWDQKAETINGVPMFTLNYIGE